MARSLSVRSIAVLGVALLVAALAALLLSQGPEAGAARLS
jgi:hypothetical protein